LFAEERETHRRRVGSNVSHPLKARRRERNKLKHERREHFMKTRHTRLNAELRNENHQNKKRKLEVVGELRGECEEPNEEGVSA
jgi:hypothetical protein